MATIPPHYRLSEVLPVAKHELGHYIVAKVLGFRTGSISITIFDFNGGHAGNSVIVPSQPLKCDESIMDYLERRVPDAWASALIAGVALITGAWIAWVWFGSEGNLTVIAASFSFGSLFGLAVGKALDKSFRFAKLRAKILEAAPRFEGGWFASKPESLLPAYWYCSQFPRRESS